MLTKEQISLSEHRFQKSADSLKQAKLLLDSQMFDGSINRSYYSIFYSIRSILCLVHLDSSKHSGVLALFDRYFVKTEFLRKNLAKLLTQYSMYVKIAIMMISFIRYKKKQAVNIIKQRNLLMC